jgi:hypothetical protein
MMRHGAALWGAASQQRRVSLKNAAFSGFYMRDGQPAMARANPAPTEENADEGILRLWAAG